MSRENSHAKCQACDGEGTVPFPTKYSINNRVTCALCHGSGERPATVRVFGLDLTPDAACDLFDDKPRPAYLSRLTVEEVQRLADECHHWKAIAEAARPVLWWMRTTTLLDGTARANEIDALLAMYPKGGSDER